ncbi:MAG: hypothetical protein JSU06_06425 [Actinobacteria bacterium]|nr:hypothetical protein [Actinomycetota bacterium]
MGVQLGPTIDPEVEELLVRFADAAMTVARPQRQFFVSRTFGAGVTVQGAGIEGEIEVAPQDLSELDRSNLIKITNLNVRGTYEFFITSDGYSHVQRIKGRVDPITAIGQTAVDYIDSADFATRHPTAREKFRVATRYASEDPEGHATRIGHDCREALHAFAEDFVRERGLTPDKAGTFAAIDAAIDHHKEDLGSRKAELLHALAQLWRAASGLAQRQEHGDSKEQPLDAEDARRVTWYVGLVMYELDRTLPRI